MAGPAIQTFILVIFHQNFILGPAKKNPRRPISMQTMLAKLSSLTTLALSLGLLSGCHPCASENKSAAVQQNSTLQDTGNTQVPNKPNNSTVSDTSPAFVMAGPTVMANCQDVSLNVSNQADKVGAGEQFHVVLTANVPRPVRQYEVRYYLPENGTYVSSTPAGVQKKDDCGNSYLSWTDCKKEAGKYNYDIVLQAGSTSGTIMGCGTIAAACMACDSTAVGIPNLSVTKTGPTEVCLGDNVQYAIVIKNSGDADAKDVSWLDTSSGGFTANAGQAMNGKIGTIPAGGSQTITVAGKATDIGPITNSVTVDSASQKGLKAQAGNVAVRNYTITKTADTSKAYEGNTAMYTITVKNTGSATLKGLKVTDTKDSRTQYVDGTLTAGANVSGNTATWTIASLAPNESAIYKVGLSSNVLDTAIPNGASVDGCKAASATASTTWIGRAGILLELVDATDPLAVGNEGVWTVRITNQGSAPLTGIRWDMLFDQHIDPVVNKATGASAVTINGKSAKGATVAVLGAKQVLEWKITAKGVKANPIDEFAKTTIRIFCDQTKEAQEESEMTNIYQ